MSDVILNVFLGTEAVAIILMLIVVAVLVIRELING